MDQVLIEMLKSSPAAVSVIVCVIIFVRYISKREFVNTAREDIRNQILRQLNNECHVFHREQAEKIEKVFKENSESIDRNTSALERNTALVARMNDALERRK